MTGQKPTVGIFGAGWVGLVTGACFADLGHRSSSVTWCPNESGVERGRPPFHEPGLAELLGRNRDRLAFTVDVDELKADARIFFCCVDTPPTPSG